MTRCTWTLVLAALSTSLAGCNWMRHSTYVLFGGDNTRKVSAEFENLPGHRLAVMVSADYVIQSDYPEIQRQMTEHLAARFRQLARDGEIEQLAVVDPGAVRDFQFAHPDWQGLKRTEIARDLEADYLLVISLMEFSTRGVGDQELYRGRLLAQANLYDARRPESRAMVWPEPGRHESIFSEDTSDQGAIGTYSTNESAVRWALLSGFADKLTKRFYDHEEEIPEDPNRRGNR